AGGSHSVFCFHVLPLISTRNFDGKMNVGGFLSLRKNATNPSTNGIKNKIQNIRNSILPLNHPKTI
ncbi:MAG: hypothetical protein ACI9E5_001354, partial [Candidatus Omnitrophota bacterium]